MRHVRRLLLIGCTLALVLGPAGRALADTPSAAQAYSCLGKIAATDQTAGTISITVIRASTALQGSIGQSLTLTVTRESVLTAISRSPKLPVVLDTVPVGDMLAVRGTIAPGSEPAVFDISRASLWQPGYRARFLCVGTVSSIDLQSGALVVRLEHGSSGLADAGASATIVVPSSARVFVTRGHTTTPGSIGQLTAGDRVGIVGHADHTNAHMPLFVASCVVARHVAPIAQLTWFACCGRVTAVDAAQGTVTLDAASGTQAVQAAVGGTLILTGTPATVIRTLHNGALATLSIAAVPIGDTIVVSGTIDHRNPGAAVYDIGQAFVWSAAK